MKFNINTLITAALIVCAVTTTAVVVHREWSLSTAESAHTRIKKAEFVKNWRSGLASATRIGSADAPVQIVEFADFECPYCGGFHRTLRAIRKRYPTQVAINFAHFPLSGHRFALPAARAVECAGDQGRFESMSDELFEHQQLLGTKSWSDYALSAGVPNLAVFDVCLKRSNPVTRIEAGKQLGAKWGVQGTPTLIVNGWMLPRPPREQELDKMVQNILAGKEPGDLT